MAEGPVGGLDSESDELAQFRQWFGSPRNPRNEPNSAQCLQLNQDDGMRTLGRSPILGVQLGSPPVGRGQSHSRYLWVIVEQEIRFILEEPLEKLGGQLPKHTHLTGGKQAYLGGEVWFKDANSLFLSGGSGRYPPDSPEQLNRAADLFRTYGYEVECLGWNVETGWAERALKNS